MDVNGIYGIVSSYSVQDSFHKPLPAGTTYLWTLSPDTGYQVLGRRDLPVISLVWQPLDSEPEYRSLFCIITNLDVWCEENSIELRIHLT